MRNQGRITGYLFAMLLALVSVQVQAATDKIDREFNHRTSGYPLTGVHTTTSCESCHVGGVFRGTPRACDGCHAVGTRVAATPKSNKHIVTDAACDTCHFNTSTFFGARYNHGTAVPGQCTNCHNGRIVEGTPRNHPVSPVAGASCDSCHRSSAWIPASWNHTDTGSDCSVCHQAAGPGRNYTVATHLPMSMPPATFTGNCKACHTNYYTFLSAFYNHSGAGTNCQNCHGTGGATGAAAVGAMTYTGVRAAGTTGMQSVHAAIGAAPFAAATCLSCHPSTATFLGARYNHSGAAATGCTACHASPASTYNGYVSLATSQIHTAATTVTILPGTGNGCSVCHSTTNFSSWFGARYAHNDAAYTAKMGVNSCLGCHDGSAPPIKAIPANHTNAFAAPGLVTPAAQTNCSVCHSSTSTWTQMNHATALVAGGQPCKNCHDSSLNPPGGSQKFSGMVQRANGHKGYNNGVQDCISCHANTYSYWNEP